jgi:hypothetical protein
MTSRSRIIITPRSADTTTLTLTLPTLNLTVGDIAAFFTRARRGQNAAMNKIRENIIEMILTHTVPDDWYSEDIRWTYLVQNFRECIPSNSRLIAKKGGRAHNYDYDIELAGRACKLEFKYISKGTKSPQWVSPMNPSQYLTKNYEEFHYDNYLASILNLYDTPIPNKEDYLKNVHDKDYLNSVQQEYYKGSRISRRLSGNIEDIKRYTETCKIAKDSIESFVEISDLNVEALNLYFREKQLDKIYLIYSKNKFRLEERTEADNTIDPFTITKKGSSYKCKTVSGKDINILLRWRNGNGIAMPAFQIS